MLIPPCILVTLPLLNYLRAAALLRITAGPNPGLLHNVSLYTGSDPEMLTELSSISNVYVSHDRTGVSNHAELVNDRLYLLPVLCLHFKMHAVLLPEKHSPGHPCACITAGTVMLIIR